MLQGRDISGSQGILFTDQYQLTMAQLYFRQGLHEREAQFDHFFRHYPDYGTHRAGYCINAGLEWLLAWMRENDYDDVSELRGSVSYAASDDPSAFERANYLKTLRSWNAPLDLKSKPQPD